MKGILNQSLQQPINLFYEEPETDRWVPFDRYPRIIVRRLIRGKRSPGGMERYYINLCAGLDLLGIPYRINDYRYIKKHPEEVAGVLGKHHVLDKIKWKNPIIFGPAVFSHPIDDLSLLQRLPIRKILLSCEWFKQMFQRQWPDNVFVWPSGINTYEWMPSPNNFKDIDILLYDKVRWDHEYYEEMLLGPVKSLLSRHGLKVVLVRYGFYREEDFKSLIKRSKSMIFLCEHETQGFAYLQTLSSNVPILAWDRGGFWQDPSYFPHKAKFAPVSSVPYWDERCGIKFRDMDEFPEKLEEFLDNQKNQKFTPREYILQNLTLERCAEQYVQFYNKEQKAN